jgi:hypothetical protein
VKLLFGDWMKCLQGRVNVFKLELQFYGSTPWLLEIIDGQLVSMMHDVLEKL